MSSEECLRLPMREHLHQLRGPQITTDLQTTTGITAAGAMITAGVLTTAEATQTQALQDPSTPHPPDLQEITAVEVRL